ncbi:MAG: Crp/Fnr family transcriptional regulator [Proteobacteria bacterium]|nr:Crp/Fnr family transcriptional regulator [Pseudomonadota bacterium]
MASLIPSNWDVTAKTVTLARLIQGFLPLTGPETAAINALCRQTLALDNEQSLYLEGDRIDNSFVVLSGWICRHHILEDGRRQITSFALPGDFLSHHNAFVAQRTHSATAHGRAVLASISDADIAELSHRFPRLGIALSRLAAREHFLLEEQVVRIGRRNAFERVGHMLLEFFHRLNAVDKTLGLSYQMPITQEVLVDALGLSLVHVNRTLRRLRTEGLIAMDHARHITILDSDRLAAIAEFSPGYLLHQPLRGPKPEALAALAAKFARILPPSGAFAGDTDRIETFEAQAKRNAVAIIASSRASLIH